MLTNAVQALNLTKRFASAKDSGAPPPAVDDLSFEIRPGESVAFLGPNGAGKSTTIEMLCGILTPTSGDAKILGEPSGSQEANRSLGLVFGTRSQLYLHMTVSECLDLIAEIYFISGETKTRRISELSELFEIGPLLRQRVRTLSLGQRMRCELVAALIHRPRVLLADEPTIGMDVVAKNQLRDLVRRWQREDGASQMLTSHDLSDVEALCDRCILIDHGKKQFDGPLGELKGSLSKLRRVRITSTAGSAFEHAAIRYSPTPDSFVHAYEFSIDQVPMSSALARLSEHYGDSIQDISIAEVSLEEVLAGLYARGRAPRA